MGIDEARAQVSPLCVDDLGPFRRREVRFFVYASDVAVFDGDGEMLIDTVRKDVDDPAVYDDRICGRFALRNTKQPLKRSLLHRNLPWKGVFSFYTKVSQIVK